jgi:hypothetical protein
MSAMSFGVLTLATPNDYVKAIGLALSIRVSNPGLPIAVACSPAIGAKVKPYFDFVIDEDPRLRGFVHKVYLDKYSPFAETLFLDSDVLVFRRLDEIVANWRNYPYTACGIYTAGGLSSFGLDRQQVLKKIGKDKLVQIDGAGHAYFRKPDCEPVFDLARDITSRYKEYAGDIPYADEDVMDIVMTILDIPPMLSGEFFSRYLSAVKGTMDMDASMGKCVFVSAETKEQFRPYMMHFAANEAPIPYGLQLHKLFRKFDVATGGLWNMVLGDIYTHLYRSIRALIK